MRAGTRLDTFLRANDLVRGRGRAMVRSSAFVVRLNDGYLLQDQWAQRIRADDILTIVLLPGKGGGGSNPLQMVLMVALAAATVSTGTFITAAYGAAWGAAASAGVAIAGGLLINAILPPPKGISVAAREQASPTYTIGAQGNRARLMEAIPCLYGRYRLYPDFAADPYSETDGNEQYVYQLFCISQGKVSIEAIRIEDNPIDSYSEVTYQVAGPGERITLFPDNVVTAAAVQSLEMKGPNEEGFETLGPFIANPADTLTDRIAIDIAFPQGLFEVKANNKLNPVQVTWVVQAQAINQAGAPIGGWFDLGNETFSAATQTPQIRTYRYSVPQGRYQVQARRVSEKKTATTFANLLQWVGMRAYLPSQESYGNVTMLAVAIRATNNINQQTQRRVNVIATRMLQVWDPVNGWSADEVATRNPAWAMADVVRNQDYGRGLGDSRQNLFELHRLSQVWQGRGDTFDGVFDTTVTLWEALTRIARVGRTLPMYYSGVIDYVRNEPKSVRRAMFSPFNIVADTFGIERKFPEFDAPDHIIVEYTDGDTWQPDEVVCALPGSALNRPFRLPLPGVINRAQAWREGMSMAASNRDQRRFISFTTEMDGLIPKYGDLVQVSHDVPAWGMSGFITDYDSTTRVLKTSEPLQWYPGENHYVALRRRDGSADGPYLVVQEGEANAMRLVSASNVWVSDGYSEEPTHYQFGPGTRRGLDAIVISALPDESGRVALNLTNYAESVHTAENGGAVPPPPPASLLPLNQNAPVVDGLTVYASPDAGFQIASATPARGALRYEFQASSDLGATWIDLGVSELPSLRIRLAEGPWRVRVRGIGALAGPWKTWTGLVTATMAPPPQLLALTATSLIFGIRLDWTMPDAPWLASTEIFYSGQDDLGTAINLGSFAVPTQTHTLMGLRAGQEFYFWARIRDVAGNAGPWYPIGNGVLGKASANADLILEYLKDQITATQLAQSLLERIESGETSAVEVEQITTALAAMYTIKTQLTSGGRTVLAGIGVGVENNEGIIESQVLVLADRFAVMHPNGSDVILPFVIQGGQVIISDTVIGTASITEAKIADAAITRAKIANAAIGEAQIEDAAIKRAKIGVAEVDYLRIAGQSATVAATYQYTGGIYVDKDEHNWVIIGSGGIVLPDSGTVDVLANVWQDMASVNSSWSQQYDFAIQHVNSGAIVARIPSNSEPRTFGENTGRSTPAIVSGLGEGYHDFRILCRAKTFPYGLEVLASEGNTVRNPDNQTRSLGIYSTTARCQFTILGHVR